MGRERPAVAQAGPWLSRRPHHGSHRPGATMSDTPNHSYNTPEKGTENWHGPLNENFENLEVDVELRDEGPPGSNNYEPADGAKYLDTVTGLVYLADGNTWTQVFDLTGGGGGGTSLSGGDGIDPSSISDGDTISVVWNDATSLDANGAINNFSLAADLDVNGQVDQLSGSVAGGQTLTNIAGTNLNIDSSGTLNASGGSGGGITGLSGGDGINPGSIGDGDTLTVDAGRYMRTSTGTVDFNGPAEWSNATQTTTNTVSGTAATVAGGENHEASASWATIGGGDDNLASGAESTVAGGFSNSAEAQEAAVGGGQANTASGQNSTVPGGEANTASGAYSFAAGREATANNDGAFVVGDSTSNTVTSQDADEARFQGEVVSESFFETDGSYAFNESGMFLNTFEDNNTGNDVFAISTVGLYGGFITQMRVNEVGDIRVTGDFDVDGNKNFVEPVETDEGEKEVVYTASEAAEARTEASGVAKVEDGRAVIELPDHFGWVTSDDEPLVVQTTPYADEPVQPQVTERSTDRIVIEDFAGVDEYEVAYTVKGTRVGQEDKQVVREPTATGPSPAPADDD